MATAKKPRGHPFHSWAQQWEGCGRNVGLWEYVEGCRGSRILLEHWGKGSAQSRDGGPGGIADDRMVIQRAQWKSFRLWEGLGGEDREGLYRAFWRRG